MFPQDLIQVERGHELSPGVMKGHHRLTRLNSTPATTSVLSPCQGSLALVTSFEFKAAKLNLIGVSNEGDHLWHLVVADCDCGHG
jgi:hypothetical protein